MKRRLLLVDDDRSLSTMLKEYLEAKDFDCDLYHNGFEALDAFRKTSYDLCILDIRMPLKNGFELAKELLTIHPGVPFLFLTGQSDKDDRIKGLEAGADDYILKPFSMQEVYLRIKAILKRVGSAVSKKRSITEYPIGNFLFAKDIRELRHADVIYKLSDIENKLLLMFCESEDGIISRDHALRQIWADENLFRERSLNVYVSKLRNYFKNDTRIEILNIHGSGYKLIVR